MLPVSGCGTNKQPFHNIKREYIMRTHKILAFGLAFVAVTAVRAQQQRESSDPAVAGPQVSNRVLHLDKIAQNYLRCLNADNPGVVESALGNVTYMRIAYPKLDLKEIQEAIFKLTMTGPSRSIRSKAFMALKVFADPSSFRSAIATGEANGDRLFADIARRMMP
jgi:hypothetical protein